MRFKFLGLFAALALLTACETAPKESASGSGTGGSSGSTAPTSTSSGSGSTTTAPAGPVAGSAEEFKINVGDRIFFGLNKYNLSGEARATLEGQAAWLKNFSGVTIAVEGHCDERGTREYNLALGDRRANSVKDYLIALGINPGRIKTISYGKERPVALGSNDAAWSQNRRGVTKITGGASG
jgi:peptidoglycan-associated lipoprotein